MRQFVACTGEAKSFRLLVDQGALSAPGLLLCNTVIAVPEGSRDALDSNGAYSLDVDAHDASVTLNAEEAHGSTCWTTRR